jgi:ubiquinone/menaquinone biosynthesis C-methylase UbiE
MQKIKNFIFKNLDFTENIFAYIRTRRNKWVKYQAQSIMPGSLVLDMGAGSCPYKQYFDHCHYISHDFKQLESSQIQDQEGYGQIDVVCDILEIPFPDQHFDVILCTEVIEHVPEPIKVIKEMSRLLKNGGILLITAPLQSGLHQEPYHYYGGYTKYWYDEFLSRNKFEQIKIESNGSLPLTYMNLGATIFKSFIEVFSKRRNILIKISAILFAIILIFPLLIFNPVICYFLDWIFKDKKFTAGYHVSAIKSI